MVKSDEKCKKINFSGRVKKLIKQKYLSADNLHLYLKKSASVAIINGIRLDRHLLVMSAKWGMVMVFSTSV